MTVGRWLALALWMWLSAAQAHLMPAGQGGMRIMGDSVSTLVSVPVALLRGVDDNGDGRLSLAELNIHRAEIDAQLASRFRLFNGDQAERILFQDLLISDLKSEGQTGTLHLILMRNSQWLRPVDALRVQADLYTPSGPDSELRLRAIRGEESELAVMNPRRMEHRFFRGVAATVADSAYVGAGHILEGYDHLLFLLTILVAGAGWRHWLAVITSFTLAHSITLTLAALAIVTVPAGVVEPLIAASIVLLAVDNLMRRERANGYRIPLVFGCGLLHGLGIAYALTELGLSGRNRIWSLLGFNLGVELGQLLIVACFLALLYVVKRYLHESWHARITQAASLAAAVIGAGWMVDRLSHLV